MKPYDHKKIEQKWRKVWDTKKVYQTLTAAKAKAKKMKPFYVLDMFPYPSGSGLHVGHPRGYIGSDVFARMKRMQGFNVLHPMGFDSFGLPAEQYAIQTGKNPGPFTNELVKRYREQLSILGFSFDWDRQVATHDPEYYKWTQWIFLQIYNSWYDTEKDKARPIADLVKKFASKGGDGFSAQQWKAFSEIEKQNILMNYRLAYQGYSEVNWCPELGTVLANDEIVERDGKMVSERGEFPVEKKSMRQWFMRITAYADRLIDGLDTIDWPNNIKEIQKNWIGKSEGSEISFNLVIPAQAGIQDNTFIQEEGPSAVRKDIPFVERNSIIAIIKHWSEDKYIGIKWKKADWDTLLTGGIEKGQTAQEAAIAEIQQETGYLHPKMIRKLSGVHSKFFHIPKNENRFVHFDSFYFKLQDGEKIALSDEEKENHDVVWLTKEQMKDFRLPESHRQVWDEFEGTSKQSVKVFTTRADTLFGVTYVVLAPEHPLIAELKHHIKNWNHVAQYIESVKAKSDEDRMDAGKEKTGVELHGVFAINPANGEQVPVWVADYVLANYGTGAVMGVPMHDDRDREFATKFELPIIDRPLVDATEITKKICGKLVTKYKMRDAIFARQRYWGEPIPLIHGADGGISEVAEKKLPLKLPNVKSYTPSGTGESPLATVSLWVKSGYETNTMPGWAGSSWYFLRYMDPKNKKSFADKKELEYFKNVDMYVGGAEHATGHLLYSRFWNKALKDLGYVKAEEPFKALRNQGMILGADSRKMSKRWGNVINPDDVVRDLGADTLRVYEAFMGPFEGSLPWSTDGIVGARRFVEKVWKLSTKIQEPNTKNQANVVLQKVLHKTIKKVTDDIANFSFNTAISAMMICTNEMEKSGSISADDFKKFLQILAPCAPHVCEELWAELGEKKSIHLSGWPKYDAKLIVDDTVKLGVQVNGKVRAEIELAKDVLEADVKNMVMQIPDVIKWLDGREVKKFIYIPGKIISIVA